MDFDRFTISLLFRNPEAPTLDTDEEARLQDAHMAHLAHLQEQGQLLAAGPVLGAPDRSLRGFSILRLEPDRARELKELDPAVRAGLYRIEVFEWTVPGGLISFSDRPLPRSIAEVAGSPPPS